MPEFPKLGILDDLLNTAEREFEATVKHAVLIDDKAQKTSGLAGLFLAAAFGFVKPESLAALRDQYGIVSLILLYFDLSLFVATVVLCLRAMWLKDVPTSGVSLESQEMSAQFLLQLGDADLDQEMMLAYRSNTIEIWKSTIAERFTANVAKTHLVHWAQRALTSGIFVSAVSLGLLGYAARNTVPSKQEKPMPEKTITPEKKPASGAPNSFPFGSGKTHALTREAVLKQLEDKNFIASQLKHVARAK